MKIKTLVSTVALAGIMCVNTFASGISVLYNGEQVTFPDAQPKIMNDRTMVPIRGIFEKMGYSVAWDAVNKTANLTGRNLIISASEDLLVATVTSNRQLVNIDTDVMPTISEGRMYLPLRAISKATGCIIEWDANTRTITINEPVIDKSSDDEDDTDFNDEGAMTIDAQNYLSDAFDIIYDIRTNISSSRDEALMKLYGMGKIAKVSPTKADYSQILSLTDRLKSLNAPQNVSKIRDDILAYVNVIESACKLSSESTMSEDEFTNKINDLQSQKNSISLAFSEDLVTYFTNNSVSYEKIFSEYCLDAMN